jgi:hypothetical protein
MAAFFLLLAILGGALVGDLVWENTTAGEATVLDRTVVSYPQGWLLAAAAALGFVIALLLVASVSSTKGRRQRRRQLRSVRHERQQRHDLEPELDHASWLDESFGHREAAAGTREPLEPESEPLYEQTRLARQHEDRRQRRPPAP